MKKAIVIIALIVFAVMGAAGYILHFPAITNMRMLSDGIEQNFEIIKQLDEIAARNFKEIEYSISQIDKKVNHYIAEEQQIWHKLSELEKQIKNIAVESYERDVELLGFIAEIKRTSDEPNFTDVVEKVSKSVVHIRCPQWQGSGFIVDEHIVATARHVVENVNNFKITRYDGKVYQATVAISDKTHDVGFIWVEENMENVVTLGSIKECRLGQDVFAIGSPYGDINFNSVTKGIISGLDRDWDKVNPRTGERYGWEVAFTTDSAGHPGNSGCPIFTMDGKVRGILVGGYSPVLICAMPCDLFLPDIERIKDMFLRYKYRFEGTTQYSQDDWYNHENSTEYYNASTVW